jgi:hypothetical protein
MFGPKLFFDYQCELSTSVLLDAIVFNVLI